MSALSIQPTYPIFTDIDGQPLESGYVWIGTANLNPITNPITVYWDADLTQPAVQPIRTVSGYPSNSGTPGRLYVNSDYSIQVQNKNATVVYSAPEATDRFSNVVWTGGGTLLTMSQLSGFSGVTDYDTVSLSGFHTPNDEAGGTFFWSTTIAKTEHDGGTIIDPDVAFPSPWPNASWFSSSNPGTGVWVRQYDYLFPEFFGAIGDGVADDQLPMQKFLNLKGGFLKSKVYGVSGTLALPNECRIQGYLGYWSSGPQSKIARIGSGTGVILQVAASPFGTPSTAARSAMMIKDISLDGNGVAEVGMYCNYTTNESRFENITATNCVIGILASKLWYCSYRDLTARTCSLGGIWFGVNYKSTYDNLDSNGIVIQNLRASNCGSRYNAVTNPFGFGASNLSGGAGIYLFLTYSCAVTTLVGEACYGPGVTIKSRGFNTINGVYTEANCEDAFNDGEVPRRYGLILVVDNETRPSVPVDGIYLNSGNPNILIDDSTAGGINEQYIISSLGNNIGAQVGIYTVSGNTESYAVRKQYDLNNPGYVLYDGKKLGAYNQGLQFVGTSRSRGPVIETYATDPGNQGWASGSTLDLARINLFPTGQARSASASVLMTVNWMAYDGGTTDSYCKMFVINAIATQFNVSITTGEVTVNITEIGTTARENNASLLGSVTLAAVVSAAGNVATVTIQTSPTSTGTQALNSVRCSAVLLGSTAGIAQSPLIS